MRTIMNNNNKKINDEILLTIRKRLLEIQEMFNYHYKCNYSYTGLYNRDKCHCRCSFWRDEQFLLWKIQRLFLQQKFKKV